MSVFQRKPEDQGNSVPRRRKVPALPGGKSEVLTTRGKNGLFSTTLIVIAVVIVLVFNLAIGQIPENWRQFDLSDTKIYSISDTTIDYVADLEQEVKLTAVATKDDTDNRIVTFLQRYANLSDKITLEWIDPVAYPSALTDYDCEGNTLIVSCEATDRTYQVSFDSILVPYYSYYNGATYYTSFDGEGQLTSAVDYVVSAASHQIYYTENHGEAAIGTNLSDRLEKNHFTTSSLSLLQEGSVPEDCELLLVNAPTTDFTEEEITQISDYLSAGGKVHVVLGDDAFEHPNLDSLLGTYGLQLTDSYVGDTSRYYAAAQSYFAFFPQLKTGTDAAENVSSDALTLVLSSFGLTQIDPARDTITVTPFLSTTEAGVMLQGEELVEGQYVLGATATEEVDGGTAQLTVCTSSLIDDEITSQFGDAIANLTVFMNTITSGFEDVSNISIDAKSLETPTNTVANPGLWSLLLVAVLPVVCLALGFVRWWKRRKL